jgi:hypothetical protein
MSGPILKYLDTSCAEHSYLHTKVFRHIKPTCNQFIRLKCTWTNYILVSVAKLVFFFSMALPAHSEPRPLVRFRNHFFSDGKTPWTSDQFVARPLPKHRTTQPQNKRTDIHALSGIRTHNPSVRASEDSSCLRPRGHRDRPYLFMKKTKTPWLESASELYRRTERPPLVGEVSANFSG